MITVSLLAAGLAMGARPFSLALAGIATYYPVPALAVVLLLMWFSRRRASTRAAVFCEAVAAELRSGDSLRNAVARAARQVHAARIVLLCETGARLEQVAGAVRSEFAEVGPELETLLVRCVDLAAPRAELFEEVADIALAQTSVSRETAAATAPVRATVVVMFGALAIGLARVVGGGGAERFLGSPPQALAAATGLLLVLAGATVALVVMARGL